MKATSAVHAFGSRARTLVVGSVPPDRPHIFLARPVQRLTALVAPACARERRLLKSGPVPCRMTDARKASRYSPSCPTAV